MSSQIGIPWTSFKSLSVQRKLPIIYYVDNNNYFMFISDGLIVFESRIRIDSSPRNDDQIDFEDNFKSDIDTLNVPIGIKIIDKGGVNALNINTQGKLKVTLDTNYNTLFQEKNSVITTVTQLIFPEKGTSFIIIHRTPNGIIHIKSDDSVSSIDFKLKEDDILEIEGNIDFELWAITESGTVDVFIMSIDKE